MAGASVTPDGGQLGFVLLRGSTEAMAALVEERGQVPRPPRGKENRLHRTPGPPSQSVSRQKVKNRGEQVRTRLSRLPDNR